MNEEREEIAYEASVDTLLKVTRSVTTIKAEHKERDGDIKKTKKEEMFMESSRREQNVCSETKSMVTELTWKKQSMFSE